MTTGTDPNPPLGNPADLLAEITKIGREGFDRGYSAGIDQLTEPIVATWLASESGLPEARCRELLLELCGMLAKVADRG